jgi:succinate dehydrogenase/fumarate reductase cytochrome b subunit
MAWQKVLIVAAFGAVLYNLGAALFYMMTDKGQSKRTVNALTWRIGLSVGLILLIVLGILTGVIEPHGVGR